MRRMLKPGAALANTLWLAQGAGPAIRYARALRDPATAQARWLHRQLQQHASSEIGLAHDFAGIRDAAAYARAVPLTDYSSLAPAIERVRRGARDVLSCDGVTHLAPTSGSTGARKLIPFTATLQGGFSQAVAAWMHDLLRQRPRLIGGPAYWSVSPLAGEDALPDEALVQSPSADASRQAEGSYPLIPIGFADDADYLGGAAAALVRQAMAAPDSLRHVRDVDSFWALSLLALLRQPALRLISVWHPSFLDLLVESAAGVWPLLLEGVASGECPWSRQLPPGARGDFRGAPAPQRAAALRRIGPDDWRRWWPQLQVVSCWGDQGAAGGFRRLRETLPGVLVQAKGLLATEGVITIPYGDARPLALTSHYFEFLDDHGEVRLAHQLQRGHRYEVVLTNGGGLWRYRLGDEVECTGAVHAAPSLRFVGRRGLVSDLRGEKLSETFVGEALRSLWGDGAMPGYAALRATCVDDGRDARYELLVSDDFMRPMSNERDGAAAREQLAARLEEALGANPHYAVARRLGQLQQVVVVVVPPETARAELRSFAGRIGDAKPRVLLGTLEGS